MGKLSIYTSIFILLLNFACSDSNPVITVVTEKGGVTEIRHIKAVMKKITSPGKKRIIGTDSHGEKVTYTTEERSERTETLKIPFNFENRFGYTFGISEIKKDDRLSIDARIILPEPVILNGKSTSAVNHTFHFYSRHSNTDKDIYWYFKKESPEYHLPGKWIFQLHNKGKLLISKEFQVII